MNVQRIRHDIGDGATIIKGFTRVLLDITEVPSMSTPIGIRTAIELDRVIPGRERHDARPRAQETDEDREESRLARAARTAKRQHLSRANFQMGNAESP
jgi:hypothetical protein